MKTITIILLFFASVGYGQDSIIIYGEPFQVPIGTFNNFPYETMIDILYYYDLYEKELQTDSIHIRTYYYWDLVRFKEKADTIIINIEPTFEGFMQWLKKQ